MITVKLHMRYIHSVATLRSNVTILLPKRLQTNEFSGCLSAPSHLSDAVDHFPFLQRPLPLLHVLILLLLLLAAPCLVLSDTLPSFPAVLNSVVITSYSRPSILLIWYPLPSRIYTHLQL